jgi:mono/diheme cytochrome c family protein
MRCCPWEDLTLTRRRMKNILNATMPFVMVFLGLSLSQPRAVEASGDPAKGKAIYEKHCMVCHGPQGKGDGPTGRLLKPPAADFTSAISKKKSEADLLQTVENGRPGTAMVPWKTQLSQPELNDVIGYVMTLRK